MAIALPKQAGNNAKQRGIYRAAKMAKPTVAGSEALGIPVQAPPVALLYLFQENRHNAHLHAISAVVWQGNQKLAEIAPVHCLGMTNRQVNAYLRDFLAVVADKFGITEFEPLIRMEPMEWLLSDCLLKVN